MYRDKFLQIAGSLCESEQIYKRMYELRDDYSARMEYLASIPREKIDSLELFIPDYTPGWLELMPEVDYLFPFDTDVAFKKHQCYTPEFKHSHTYFEIIYVYEGSCSNTVGDEEIRMHAGDICFVTPEKKHSIAVFDDSIVINILVKKSTFQKTFNNVLGEGGLLPGYLHRCLLGTEDNHYLVVHTGKDEFVRSQTELLYMESYDPQKYSGDILSCGFKMVFYYVLRNHADNMELKYHRQHDRKVISILNYIQNNYIDITLESTAAEFHYNPSYLSRLLKETTGKSFVQLLRDCRMEIACKQLRNTDRTVREIASSVGFDNVEHFNRLFRKEFSMTPIQFRDNLR